MSKKNSYIVIVVLILIGLAWFCAPRFVTSKPININTTTIDAKNCAYSIEGERVVLKNGYYENTLSDSSVKEVTRFFGNEYKDDFTGAGFLNSAFVLTQDRGGSGTFYYIAVALGTDIGCKGTNAIFLGDRISPQSINFKDGKIIVYYTDRSFNESMSSETSIDVYRYFRVQDGALVEVK